MTAGRELPGGSLRYVDPNAKLNGILRTNFSAILIDVHPWRTLAHYIPGKERGLVRLKISCDKWTS